MSGKPTPEGAAGQSGKREPHSVDEVLEELDHLADENDEVTIADVLDDFGGRSFGPFLIVPPLVELTPIGGIPGAPTFLALIVATVAVQLLLQRDHIWLPRFIQQRAVTSDKLHKAVRKLEGVAKWLDGLSHGRLSRFTKPFWERVAAAVIILLCMAVVPLELLPFASSGPMLAIIALGIAIMMRDGALMLGALCLSALAFVLGAYFWFTSDPSGSILPF